MIYKPTDLSPSLQAFDVSETPIFFECKIDTSNIRATGFTIKVLDSENNVVFSSVPVGEQLDIKYLARVDALREYVEQKFPLYTAGYDSLNTGYNGTYLKIPFVVNSTDEPSGNVVNLRTVQIYYKNSDKTLYRRTIDGGEDEIPVNIYNGHEYKWSITLYQLENNGTDRAPNWILPKNPLYYDMPLTTGTILGSNDIRIQSVVSDEIYSDYFVQPVLISGLTFDPNTPTAWSYTGDISQNNSNRAMIKSYDPTYGYIYPVTGEGGFAAQTITPDNANGFQVYKRGNNNENLNAYQKVSYVIDVPLDSVVSEPYQQSTTYNKDDVVTYNGLYYKCRVNNTGQEPESGDSSDAYWSAYGGPVWEWVETIGTPGNSYGLYTYYVNQSPDGVYFINGRRFIGSERTILNAQVTNSATSAGGEYLGSPFNGIYYPQFTTSSYVPYNSSTIYYAGDMVVYGENNYSCTGVVKGIEPGVANNWTIFWKQVSDSTGASPYNANMEYSSGVIVSRNNQYYECTGAVYAIAPPETSESNSIYWKQVSTQSGLGAYKITVRWLRTPDADSWGELMTKIVLVTDDVSPIYQGKNLQIRDINDNADAYGTINETPFLFVPERPVEIYKNNYPLYQVGVSYNTGDVVSYLKSGEYAQWDSSENYSPGAVVYYADTHYICIASNAGKTPTSSSKEWAEYKARSYYVCNVTNPSSPPVNEGGVLQNGWTENKYLGTTGLIFYNRGLSSDSDDSYGLLYIRHFDGIQNGMTLFQNSTSNEQTYVYIDSYNPTYNFVTYSNVYRFNTYEPYSSSNPSVLDADVEWIPANLIGGGTKYQIKTFFRASDETAFSFYTRPVVGMHFTDPNGIDFIDDRVLTEKSYEDYIDNISEYTPGVYNVGDMVKYNNKLYESLTDGNSSTPPSNWEEITDKTTTTYNKYFSYGKDEIVEYDNKNDFLLYNAGQVYSYYDKVRFGGNFYISKVYDNTSQPSDTNSWGPVNLSDLSDSVTTVKYIAKTSVPVGLAPSGQNLGTYWEQYIGVLPESKGFVPLIFYSPDTIYDVGTNVFFKGLYYNVLERNQSYSPDNASVWAKTTTDISGAQYEVGYTAFGPYSESVSGDPGKLYVYSNSGWVLYSSPEDQEQEGYKYIDGIAYDAQGEYTDFDSDVIYLKGGTVFYNGYNYTVTSYTTGHMLDDPAYFQRTDKQKPLSYPSKNNNKSAIAASGVTDFQMGDIVLAKGSDEDAIPDRYYVKINNNDDEASGTTYVPNLNNWQVYYGPMYVTDIEDAVYNSVFLSEEYGLYFVKTNNENYGTPVVTANAGTYQVSRVYAQNDIVLYNNTFYICIQGGASGQRPSVKSNYWDIYTWQIYTPEITARTLVVSADYTQQQYIQWRNAQWFLYDATGTNLIDKSDVLYDGELSYTFYGLDGKNQQTGAARYYIVRLTIETYSGYKVSFDETIKTVFTVTEMDPDNLVDVYFDCDTTAVVTTITKESGFVEPSILPVASATYSIGGETFGDNTADGEMNISGEIEYKQVVPTIGSGASQAAAIKSNAERFLYQTEIHIDSDTFAGNLLSVYSADENTDKNVGNLSIFLPEMLVTGTEESSDEILNSTQLLKINPSRNQFAIEFNTGDGDMGEVELSSPSVYASDGILINEDGRFDSSNFMPDGEVYHPYITVPSWQRADYETSSYDLANVLPISYEAVLNSSGDLRDDTHFNVSLPYNIYYNGADEDSSDALNIGDIRRISPPAVSSDSYSVDVQDGDVSYQALTFMITDPSIQEEGQTEIYVRGETATMWSDYLFDTPVVRTGRKTNEGGTPENFYTRKNAWTKFGWEWHDDSSASTLWQDADVEISTDGVVLSLGSITINGAPVDSSSYETLFVNDGAQRYSGTYFEPQVKIENIRERKILKNVNLTFDLDLTMDADGFITPTVDSQSETGDPLKMAVYVSKKS